MADALVSALFQVILGNLNSAVLREFGSARGLKRQLEKLESVLSTIQAVLQDAEKRQHEEAVRNWLTKLKDAAYDADDLLDEFTTEALLQRSGIRSSRVRNFFSFRDNPLVFRFKMGNEMNKILERLDAIAGERSKFHLTEGVRSTEVDEFERRHTSSFVIESEIYGRDEEKEKIIQSLLDNAGNEEGVSVHAIFGMGGVGKTTLAQLVFNDVRIKRHFESRMWVCVSQYFEIITVTKAIIESASGCLSGLSELDPLQRRLCELLSGKRFLLVLDDMWNEDQEKWNKVKPILTCGAKGSSIIVTTRTERVARTLATLHTRCHHLGGLSNDDCWSLFRERAFGFYGREDPNLVAIGEEIVRKCGGVPLAVKALGGLLRFKSKECEWLSVKESKIWDLPDDGSDILPSLRLSYNHLPSHLRQCFAYCSLFPKDQWIHKEKLIQLWMANGFISLKGQMELEDIGNEIFDDLLWRSFFQDPVRDEFGNIIECKMHDLMHDLAQFIMKNECFTIEPNRIHEVKKRHRHLTCKLDYLMTLNLKDRNEFLPLRSLLVHGAVEFPSNVYKIGALRALECTIPHELPKFICKCKHLRYLNLSSSFMKILPESIICLQNLQTLILRECYHLHELPKGMRHMRKLRNLDIGGCPFLKHMPSSMGQLTCLQVLSTYIVGKDNGCQIGELKDLDLKGEIEIKNLGYIKNLSDAKTADLVRKHRLDSLTLTWQSNVDAGLQVNVEEVLEGLQPPSSLKRFVVRQYLGSTFPNWISDSLLPNLIEVRLGGCEKCECLPRLGELPLLEFLEVSKLNVKYLYGELDGDDALEAFKSLHTLYVFDMPSLEGLTSVERRTIFPCLQRLHITGCHKFTMLPHLSKLTDLCIQSCDSLIPLPQLPSLHVLNVNNGNVMFSEEGLRGSSSLKSLVICNSPQMISLTEGLQYLTALRVLYVSNCPKLTCLPKNMQHLASISQLFISDCPNLMSLPEALQHLTTLKYLSISGCPHLKQRSLKEIGEDWHKIAHIPQILIDLRRIEYSGPLPTVCTGSQLD